MRIFSRFLVVLMVVALPFVASAQTTDELKQQVNDLLARVSALQAQLGASNVGAGSQGSGVTLATSACPMVGTTLKLGSSGDSVSRLQRFLATDSSVYPQGTISGYFGSLTQAAVQRWQAKNNIVSSGSPSTTGYGTVGPRTAAAMAQVCSGTAGGSGSVEGSVGPSPVGGFIKVTPITGNAPLAVAIQTTVNTTNSCSGATYSLDYGDGSIPSQITVPVGNCFQMNQTLGHTYQYGGTYKITLSSGEHSVDATVTVSGASAPSSGSSAGGSSGGMPRGTISAFVNYGPAPLTTTFYISCAAGVAYNVVFGDGQELGSTGVANSNCTGSLQAVSHTYTSAGTFQVQLIVFVQQSNGTIVPITIATTNITTTGGSSDGSGLGSLSIAPSVGGDPLHVQAQFDVGNCQAYTVRWGDGQVSSASPACSGTGSVISVDHVYQSTGSYTLTLTRGTRVDTLSVTISS